MIDIIDINELINLWRKRKGLFAKVRYNSNNTSQFRFGVVTKVLDSGILILSDNTKPNVQFDIPLKDITESSVEEVKEVEDDTI